MNRASYEASRIDWHKINSFARKVASETSIGTQAPLTYTETEFTYVKMPHEVKSGFLGLGRSIIIKTEQCKNTRTIEVVGPHWVLDHRSWFKEDASFAPNYATETHHADYYTVLKSSGELKKVVISTSNPGNEKFTSCENLKDEDVVLLDYRRKYYESNRSGVRVKSDRDKGDQLLRHAKGVGISLLLKELLKT